MSNEHFKYDADELVIRLKDERSATLLQGLLTAGKFAERLDAKLLLNDVLADLIRQLSPTSMPKGSDSKQHGRHFDPKLMLDIGKEIAAQGQNYGWWQMTKEQQLQFIREVVAPPHIFSQENIDQIFDSIESCVIRARNIATAAEKDS